MKTNLHIKFIIPKIMTLYKTNLDCLLDELCRIHMVVSFNKKLRPKTDASANDFQGLYITEKEVDAILQKPPFELSADTYFSPELDGELSKIENLTLEIGIKKRESLKAGKELRLHTLSELFHLSPFDVDVLLLCLLSELDLRYEKVYSYMQNDVTRKRPTIDLVIKYLCRSPEEMFRAREAFSPSAPLLRNRLIYLSGDGQEAQVPLLSRNIKLDERIVGFLIGSNDLDQRIRNFSSIVEPKRTFNDLILAEDHKNMLIELMRLHSNPSTPMMLFFHGAYGTGKKTAAEAVCRELGTPLLIIDSKVLVKDDSVETLKITLREAMLQNSSVYLEGIDALWKEKDAGAAVVNLINEFDRFPSWVFLSGELPFEAMSILKNHGFINIAFPIPAFELRRRLWESFLNGDNIDISPLASKFKFSGGQIKDAVFTARNIAAAKGSKLSLHHLYHGCKARSSSNLSTFARKIEPRYNWEDIILPKDKKEQLKEIAGYIKNREIVYTDWGFDKKLSIGKGLNVLFSGPSGTGKTMAAEIIAKDAGLDLFKIDLSNIVSKYIGETEKNLSKIFKEAETCNAILFFDEADALFGKRSEVKDAHDRYANIEIGYLLQKMEEYEGIVILATNLSKNIDDAFLRRMQFVVEFPFPDEKQRMQIWSRIFPEDAPLSKDIDYRFFSDKLKVAGGNIKNIALTAAFYAAEDSCGIGMHHIMHAARREYQKIGKPFLKTDFEPYCKLIEWEDK